MKILIESDDVEFMQNLQDWLDDVALEGAKVTKFDNEQISIRRIKQEMIVFTQAL